MTRTDWTLVMLSATGSGVFTPVQLQKALFIVGREFKNAVGDDFYEFVPYDYGPFCSDIYKDAQRLEREGLVTISQGPGLRRYSATPDGVRRASSLRESAPPKAVAYADKIAAFVRSLSFEDLVRAVYARYPEMRANSVFRG